MAKVAVVYWSGTGNTQAVAEAVAEGAKAAGAEVELFTAGEFSADKAADYDKLALGCPAMGSEELEDSEFLPLYEALKPVLSGKPVVLFGSYGWGGGEWLETWNGDAEGAGLTVAGKLAVEGSPDDDAKASAEELGKTLANA